MKRFRKSQNIKNQIIIVFLIITFFVCFFIYFFSIKWSAGIIRISKLKVNEVTTNIVNDAVLNYKKSENNINDLIKIVVNKNDEIISVDIDMEKGYSLLEGIVNEIRNNIKKFQQTDYLYYNMESLSYVRNGIVISIPMGAVTGKNLIVNLGPKIPVKLSLLENVKGVIRTELKDYGINNALLNVYIKIEIEQNIEMPSATKSFYNTYEMLIASKMIQGTVPSFISEFKGQKSEIVQIPVN